MGEPRKLSSPSALAEIIADRGELQKGAQIYDGKQLNNLARFENKLFADAQGSGASPYKVSLIFGDTLADVKGRCSCMAARTRPFCKHPAALLVAWSRAPDAFVTAEAPPAGPTTGAAKKVVKKGRTETADLMKTGVEQMGTLVRELAMSGLATVSGERHHQVRAVAESLRANGLGRLSARALELALILEAAGTRTTEIEPAAF